MYKYIFTKVKLAIYPSVLSHNCSIIAFLFNKAEIGASKVLICVILGKAGFFLAMDCAMAHFSDYSSAAPLKRFVTIISVNPSILENANHGSTALTTGFLPKSFREAPKWYSSFSSIIRKRSCESLNLIILISGY